MVLARRLTSETLENAIWHWESMQQKQDQGIELACRYAYNKEEIFYREETWNGAGAQAFHLGDYAA